MKKQHWAVASATDVLTASGVAEKHTCTVHSDCSLVQPLLLLVRSNLI